ncbi:hypothetical protein Tco_0829109 [Tanacetum coccineum]
MAVEDNVPQLADKKGGFVNSFPEKWLSFSQGLRNANHTHTLDLADIYKNSDDEADVRTSEEYLRDLELEFYDRALLANLKCFIKRKNNFSSKKGNESTECYKYGNKGHFEKRLFFHNKGLVAETFDWDEEEIFDDEEMTQVNVLMALADDEQDVGKNHAHNGEWIDITMRKVNILLSMEDSDWQTYLKYINIDLKFVKEQRLNIEQIPNQKKKIFGGEQLTESSSKNDVKENPFIPASLDYNHEMVSKSKDCVERHNPDNKLLKFNTRRILVLESQDVNECLKLTEAPTDLESSKESGSEPLTPLPLPKNM